MQPIIQKSLQPHSPTQYAFLHVNTAAPRICPLTVACSRQLLKLVIMFYCMRFRCMLCTKFTRDTVPVSSTCHFSAATFLTNMQIMWAHDQIVLSESASQQYY